MEYGFRFTKDDNGRARQLFERAIELDPQYADAYARLGWTYWREWIFQWSQDPQTFERVLEMVQKAMVLDDSLPGPHMLLGHVYHWKDRQYEQGVAEGEKAIALDPSNDRAYEVLAELLMNAGRYEDALRSIKTAMRLNPYYPVLYIDILGVAYRMTGRYEEAMATLKKVLTLDPDFLFAYYDLAVLYSELGREAEARAAAAEILRIDPNFSLEVVRQTWPKKDQAQLERELAALRKAGLK